MTTASFPTSLSAGQRVPQVRSDLQLSPDGSGAGTRVLDPTTGVTHVLRDVEVSLARMLNGQRTAEEVVAGAQRIGLPITVDTLGRFIGKLRQLGLLAEGAPTPGPGPWPDRQSWATPARELYQEALKAFRSDQLSEAAALLERQLSEAPTPEAQQLLAQVRERLSGGAGRSFAEEWGGLEQSWFDAGAVPPPEEEAAPTVRRSRAPLVVVGLLAVGGVAALLVPFPFTVQVPVVLRGRASQPVTLPHAGTLAAVDVADGQWVEAGAVLARFDAAGPKAAVEKAQEKLKALRARAAAPDKKRAAAKAALDKAEAALAKAEAAAKGKKPAAVKAATKAKAAAEKQVTAARARYAAAGGDAADKLAGEVEAAEKVLAAAQAEAAAATVTAPAAGQVSGLAVKPAEKVKSGAPLLWLDDAAVLRAELDVAPKDRGALKVGQDISLHVGGKAVAAKLSRVDEGGVVVEVDNAARALQGGARGTATLALASRSILGRL